jgi:aldehyde dehydrogenase (NAD+)
MSTIEQTSGKSKETPKGAAAVANRQILVGGELIGTEAVYPSLDPATGEVLGYAPDASREEAEAAIAAARRAFDTTDWSTNTQLRQHCLEQLYQVLRDNVEELRELTISEVGSTRALTRAGQLELPFEIVRYYADLLRGYNFTEDFGAVEYLGQQHRRWVEKEAAGVVSAIVAYNFPNQLALAKIVPALAAGCTVVLKAAPETPLITLAIGELIARYTDIPAGVVNVLSSSDVAVGELMTTHPEVDVVTFTGSSAVGRKIMTAAGDTLKRVFLELGGKSAAIVLDDADHSIIGPYAAFGITMHAGQACALNSRLLVPRRDHDAIAASVGECLRHVRYGDPRARKTYMGPLISERQREKVHGMVERAVAAGATLITGGAKVGPGFFYEPTLLADVDPDSEIAQEEVFGPVLAMIPYEDVEDAVRIANNSAYGLSGAVFGADEQRALEIARRIRTGTFSINGGNYFHPDVPFGGYKQSGIGREMGEAGMEEFLERKTLAVVLP